MSKGRPQESALDESRASARDDVRGAVYAIVAVSLAAVVFLFWLIYFKPTPEAYAESLTFLPAMNAVLNGLSATAVCVGVYYISRRDRRTHKRFMLLAFMFSSAFLVGYILNYSLRGDTKFQGTGAIRYIYFFILISHVLLSIVALPMILTTFYLSLSGRLSPHKKLARVTFPLWLYVSVTGVVVYILLHQFYPSPPS